MVVVSRDGPMYKQTVLCACYHIPFTVFREPSILVSYHSIQAGDGGSIIVGGRPSMIDYRLNTQRRCVNDFCSVLALS